jgi:hypothetical protein
LARIGHFLLLKAVGDKYRHLQITKIVSHNYLPGYESFTRRATFVHAAGRDSHILQMPNHCRPAAGTEFAS